jgi:hypothetical protein
METNMEDKQTEVSYVAVWSYDNYIPANIALGRLEEDGFDCWLRDENTVTIDPILTNAVGGIKLMVETPRAKEAYDLLKQLQDEHRAKRPCPKCGSSNVELVSTPRKAMTWISAITTFFMGDYAMSTDKVYHCFNCKNEFSEETPTSDEGDTDTEQMK